MDWSIITPRISCGGGPDPNGIQGLLRYGHTHIIDLRHTDEDADLYFLNFAYLKNPSYDDGATKETGWFDRSIRFALGALIYPDHRLYVGCHTGLHRAPSTVLAIMLMMGWPLEVAASHIENQRPGVELRYMHDAHRAYVELSAAKFSGPTFSP